jgi:hypothetical protein
MIGAPDLFYWLDLRSLVIGRADVGSASGPASAVFADLSPRERSGHH